MVGLSEKAKGKQRAVEPQDVDASGSQTSENTTRTVTIRFTDGLPDLNVSLEPKDTVQVLKKKIRQDRPQVAKRRLRLIYSGRILTDKTLLADWLNTSTKRQQKIIENQAGKEKGNEDAAPSVPPAAVNTTWLHCSVGAEMTAEEEDDESATQKTQIKTLRGFDRLAAAGFSEEDIAQFRRTFHSQNEGDYIESEDIDGDDDFEAHARELEEQWIDSLDDPGNTSLSQASAPTTMLQGLMLGFFFPLIPFFFVRELRPAVFWEDGSQTERIPSVIFSKRMQMALVLGFMVNITFGTWRYLLGG